MEDWEALIALIASGVVCLIVRSLINRMRGGK